MWLNLGEAQSKCEHLAGVPLRPDIAAKLHAIFLAKGVHATTAIEGNTLTEQQVSEILQKKISLPESQKYLQQEVQNIIEAANEILASVERSGHHKIASSEIKKYNKFILKNLEVDAHVVPGEVARVQVGVMNYRGAPPEDLDFLLDKLCEWLNGKDFQAENESPTIHYGILKSILAHLYIAWIHPFGDGNGRTARLLEVRFLLESGVPSAAAHLLSNHYNKTRSQYYRELDKASKSGGDVVPFIEYALGGLVDQLKEQIQQVKHQQWNTAWINFVYDKFGQRKSDSDRRQLKLALALSDSAEGVARSEISTLTPELARLYANKTGKTITRDISALRRLELIERSDNGYRATKEQILAFLPRSMKGEKEKQVEEAKKLTTSRNQLAFDF
jgi:Fic family protein